MKVFYHANCNDGKMAAYLWWKAFPDADFIPVGYDEASEALMDVDDIRVFLDYCPKNTRPSDTIIDHHPICGEQFSESDCMVIYGENECGATLVADYLDRDHWLLPFIRDRDLWLGKYPLTDAYAKAVSLTLELSFDEFEEAIREPEALAVFGRVCLAYEKHYVSQRMRHLNYGECEGRRVAYCNNTLYGAASALGHAITKQEGCVAGMWGLRSDGLYSWSFRGPGARETAQFFGGGGHPEAAGAVSEKGPEAL